MDVQYVRKLNSWNWATVIHNISYHPSNLAKAGQLGVLVLPLGDVTALEDSSPLPALEYKGILVSQRSHITDFEALAQVSGCDSTSLRSQASVRPSRRLFSTQETRSTKQRSTTTMSAGLELIGIVCSILGWLLAIVSCALPMWRVTAFIGSNIVTAQIIWDGLWMSCVVQSTGQMQCKVYDSMLALSQDLQAARALTVISILLTVLAVLVSIAGAKCTNCIEDESSKAKVMIIAGVLFIIAGLMQLIPVCWSANTIIRDFYNPLLTDAQRRELGAALYIGWAAAALLMMGGSLLCCSCPPQEKKYNPSRMAYSTPRSTAAALSLSAWQRFEDVRKERKSYLSCCTL
uniref:Uncharacterized protein n=1 Tax=Astyanax mexicanus TaxID=7994 RepID=A0A3B1JWX3_ASTMX